MLRVPRSSTCLNCGYDLAGIGAEGKCPECGVRASVSRSGDALVTAPVGYLLRMHLSAGLLSWMWVAAGVMMVISAGATLGGVRIGESWGWHAGEVLLSVGFVIAQWMVTPAQPRRFRPPAGNTWRILVRAAAAGGLCVSVVEVLDRQRLYGIELGLIGFVCVVVGHVAMCVYLRAMARRLRDEPMLVRAGRLIWLPITVGLGAFLLASTLGTWLAVVGYIAAYAMLALGYLFVLARFRAGLSKAMDVAARRELAEGESEAAGAQEGACEG